MLKLGYNEATCKENSTVENDLLLCEKYGYDYIELRLDMLQEYLKTHTVDDLAFCKEPYQAVCIQLH